jgi:DNA-directed RNA polymerase specialized sigma subunit
MRNLSYEQEQICPCCRFDEPAMTYGEIARHLGLSRQTVERIANQALAKLRSNPLAKELWQ